MRIVIRPTDIQILLGIKYNSATNLIGTIKSALKKEKKHRLTIQEFCEYEGLPVNLVIDTLKPHL